MSAKFRGGLAGTVIAMTLRNTTSRRFPMNSFLRHLIAGATMLASSALLASGCVGAADIDCGPGESCECDGIGACHAECVGGDCDMRCEGQGACNFDCPEGGCRATCEGQGACTLSCPGGDCTLSCRGAGACEIEDCEDGQCEVR
jgi:hypothetical protein